MDKRNVQVELKVTPPAAPTGLSAVDAGKDKNGNDQARISWNAVPGATSYKVIYYSQKDGWISDDSYAAPKTATSYISTGLGLYSSYKFRIIAVNSAGESPWAEITYNKPTVTQTSGGPIWPVDGYYTVTSLTHYSATATDTHGTMGGRNKFWAMDIEAPENTPILAIEAGNVKTVSKDKNNATGFGFYIVISHAGGSESLYGHMSKASTLVVGQPVEKGTVIGYVGNTGISHGNHLHLEWTYHNPYKEFMSNPSLSTKIKLGSKIPFGQKAYTDKNGKLITSELG